MIKETEAGKLMERMYRLFSIRQRTEKEVRQYFKIKNYRLKILAKEQTSNLVIEQVIKKLKQKKLLNDEEFARNWLDCRSKKKGKIAIKIELLRKGIDKKIIDDLLEENPVDEEVAAQHFLEKKKNWKNLPLIEFKKKAYPFLIRRGFRYELVKSVVEKFLQKQ
ncbi:RecX family transcriptional regulator [Candidatus Daviesbacteria bacterium]|nr:RecX family transcriptional regulator [Candidatus Daviesbacteria bacterium]